ncbi:MAG: hypothetical protein ABWY20_02305 [Mycobacterium sp.]
MKRLAAVLVSAPMMLFPAVANADPSGDQGQPNATEDKEAGAPTNGVGHISTFAHQLNEAGSSLGDHSNNFAPGQRNTDGGGATGRVGVGNLGRTDGLDGDDPNSHFTGQLVTVMGDAVITTAPGNTDNPKRQGNPNADAG